MCIPCNLKDLSIQCPILHVFLIKDNSMNVCISWSDDYVFDCCEIEAQLLF